MPVSLKTKTSTSPIIATEAYRTFVSFMFAAAMVAWGATLLGLTPFVQSPTPGAVIEFPKDEYLLAAILYGGVLISFYWLYTEKLARYFLPTNLAFLLLDFVALSFMTGAATTWRDKEAFATLAIWTLVLLSCRFGLAAFIEIRPRVGTRKSFVDMIMTHILGVYSLCFLFLGGVEIGAYASGVETSNDNFVDMMYYLICLGMAVGIVVTGLHSFRHIPHEKNGTRLASASGSLTHSPADQGLPVLVPAYGAMDDQDLKRVAAHVFLGETTFRRLLRDVEPSWSSPFSFHQSRVHTYRDVETQAFIMAHHGATDTEIELRAMWVYLAHWFDDLFDDQFTGHLANTTLVGDFDIGETLVGLDCRVGQLWTTAVAYTKRHASWDEELFTIGFRRLIIGGPMFAPHCESHREAFARIHHDFVMSKIESNDPSRELIANVPMRYLSYTAKVVVELWDSFDRGSQFATRLRPKTPFISV